MGEVIPNTVKPLLEKPCGLIANASSKWCDFGVAFFQELLSTACQKDGELREDAGQSLGSRATGATRITVVLFFVSLFLLSFLKQTPKKTRTY